MQTGKLPSEGGTRRPSSINAGPGPISPMILKEDAQKAVVIPDKCSFESAPLPKISVQTESDRDPKDFAFLNLEESPWITIPDSVRVRISVQESASAAAFLDIFSSTVGDLLSREDVCEKLSEVIPNWLYEWLMEVGYHKGLTSLGKDARARNAQDWICTRSSSGIEAGSASWRVYFRQLTQKETIASRVTAVFASKNSSPMSTDA